MTQGHIPAAPKPPRRECFHVDSAFLVEIGWLNDLPANNAPWYTFGPGPASSCDHWIEMQYRDGDETWCPLCSTENRHSRLRRKILAAPHATQVWHSFHSHVTGREESDRRSFERHGSDHAKKISDELGIGHSFSRTDASDLRKTVTGYDRKGRDREAVAGEALRATHDRAVAEGRKESKGKTVHTLSD